MKRALILTSCLIALYGCGEPEPGPQATTEESDQPAAQAASPAIDDWLGAAIAGHHRSAEYKARDVYRHPGPTLEFFGLEADMTVVELWPGRGWYTEILAPALKGTGRLIVASYNEDNPEPAYRARMHREFVEKLEANPEVYGEVEVAILDPARDLLELAPAGSADMVVTFRNTHSWINRGSEEAVFTACYDALKPGGVLGVVQHRGEAGWDASESARKGYVPEQYVVELAEAAGFRLDAKSEINANPADTKDYPEGVWTLPPSLRLEDQDRERYLEIGESDRMTLRFVKP